jgi:hypothetical protein
MKPDLYTKAVLTVIALLLALIACKPLLSPETTASAQGALAGVQFSTFVAEGNRTFAFFDSRTGEAWFYDGGDLKPNISVRLTKLGDRLVQVDRR